MSKVHIPISEIYGLLETGPVVLISTAAGERANVMTQSWHTMIEFEPAILACVISDRNHTYGILKRTKECVINIPTIEIAEQVVGCGNTSGRDIDKFETFCLASTPASLVNVPMIEACYANLECRVIDGSMIEKYGLFILEVVAGWIDPAVEDPKTLHHRGRGAFMIAGETIVLPSKMK